MQPWYEWNGEHKRGPAVDKLIDVKFRDGDIWFAVTVDDMWWDHNGRTDDIVEWRYHS